MNTMNTMNTIKPVEYVYELVNTTQQGHCYSMGLFPGEKQALGAVVSQEILDFVKHNIIISGRVKLQIRKRFLGMGVYDDSKEIINIAIWEGQGNTIQCSVNESTEKEGLYHC